MKFCPVVPEICRGQVHGARKERRRIRIIIIIRNGAKTISLQTLFGRLNNINDMHKQKSDISAYMHLLVNNQHGTSVKKTTQHKQKLLIYLMTSSCQGL
jgi:hypothetical protein